MPKKEKGKPITYDSKYHLHILSLAGEGTFILDSIEWPWVGKGAWIIKRNRTRQRDREVHLQCDRFQPSHVTLLPTWSSIIPYLPQSIPYSHVQFHTTALRDACRLKVYMCVCSDSERAELRVRFCLGISLGSGTPVELWLLICCLLSSVGPTRSKWQDYVLDMHHYLTILLSLSLSTLGLPWTTSAARSFHLLFAAHAIPYDSHHWNVSVPSKDFISMVYLFSASIVRHIHPVELPGISIVSWTQQRPNHEPS